MLIFKIVDCKNGTFSVNQECNGYWWYHELALPGYAEAAAWCKRHANGAPYEINEFFIPRNMR
jgi:hypothetical protein